MYIGRFAPSPTGPLHQGSLLCAVASFLDARANNGKWLLRIEDLDPPREVAGASDAIIEALQTHGLVWDEELTYQSRRLNHYASAFSRLQQSGHLFRCQCSKRQLRAHHTYPGTCKTQSPPPEATCSWRVAVPTTEYEFADAVQGRQSSAIARTAGDFIVKRKDGLHAYQLAVVVDDALQGITHVVRGFDLLDSTVMQLHLQTLLELEQVHYAHVPIVVNDQGEKLSKQRLSDAIDNSQPDANLRIALAQLRQASPPRTLRDPGALLRWAAKHWDLTALHKIQHVENYDIKPG